MTPTRSRRSRASTRANRQLARSPATLRAMRGASRCGRAGCAPSPRPWRDDRATREPSAERVIAAAGAHRLLRRADAAALHSRNACFTRRSSPEWYAMTASVAAGREPVAQRGQRARQTVQLVVDGDAHRLEESREVRRAGARAERAADGAHEIVARGERPVAAAADDLAREPARPRLVAELAEDARELAPRRPRRAPRPRCARRPRPCACRAAHPPERRSRAPRRRSDARRCQGRAECR